ncbi:MAG: Ig-like domain-containing protein [Gammaproteobacteria bacterium]|nr:Ig-like domain-containing protein [Gammaproteobacteria bacterium]
MERSQNSTRVAPNALRAFLISSFAALVAACGGGTNSPDLPNTVNSTLQATDDTFNLDGANGPATLNVLANDSFGDGARVFAVAVPDNGGTLAISPDGQSIIYTPPIGYSGVDRFTYVLTDNSGQTSNGEVNLSVSNTPSVNIPPLALPDVFTVVTDSTGNNLSVLANDVDPNGDTITLTSAAIDQSVPPATGENIAIDAVNGTITYTPPAGFVGLQTIGYTISDGNGGLVSSTAAVTVSPLPVGPVAIADVFTVTTDAAANDFDVLANDIDLSSSGLTLSAVSLDLSVPPASGSVVSVNNGQLSYAPAAGFIGVDTVTYTVTDGNGQTGTGLATFTVTPLAVPPVALPDVAIVQPDTTNNSIDALANDVDLSGTNLSITSATSVATVPVGAVSTITTDGNTVSYSPAAGFIGVETLSYVATDGNGETATGVITVTVLGLPTAPPPVAVVDVANVSSDSSNNSIDALSNDIDTVGNGLTISNVTSLATVPLGATSTVSTDGSTITYTPAAGFIGVETLSYTITDDNGATSTAAITIVVAGLPTALPPVAVPDVALVNGNSSDNSINPLANDVDTTSSGLTITATSIGATVPPTGTGTVTTDGSTLTYTPANGFAGVETINYTITDGNGTTSSSIVTVTVSPLPLPPVAVPDIATVLAESSDNTINALANDADVASAGLTITSVSSTATLPPSTAGAVSTDGSTITYTPATGFNGVETLSYEITDGNSNTATGLITITVSPLAAPPVAIADITTVNQDSSDNSIVVLDNDIDLAGGGLTVTSVSSVSSVPVGSTGTATTDGTTVTYTPAASFAGVEVLQYEITDNNGTTGTGLITVTVVPTVLAAGPVAVPDVATVTQDSSNNLITVITNDVDPASGGLTLNAVTVLADLPATGGHTAVVNGSQVDFTPAAGYSGVVTLQYTIEDSNSATTTGTAVVTVSPIALNPPPVTVPDVATVTQDSSNNLISVIGNDIDTAGGGLTLTAASVLVDLPVDGNHTVTLNGNQIDFTPTAGYAGLVTLQYTIEDSNGTTATGTAAVTVTALPVEVPPLAIPDVGTMSNSAPADFDVAGNDLDPAGGGLTVQNPSIVLEVLPPILGSNAVSVVGNQLRVTPASGYIGVITVSYEVEDTNGNTSTSTAVITVGP